MTATRRQFARQRLEPPVRVRIPPASIWEVLDLSENGMGVRSAEPLIQGEIIRMQIPLPRRASLGRPSGVTEGSGEVVWTTNSGRAGIRFLEIAEDSRQLLREWIQRNESAHLPRASVGIQSTTTPVEQTRPVSRAGQYLAIIAVAILFGTLGGIWLAVRDFGLIAKRPVPDQDVGQFPKQHASIELARAEKSSPAPKTPQAKARAEQPAAQTTPITLPSIRAMHLSHQPGHTTVDIELGTSTMVRAGRLHNPERLYFDLQDGHREKGIARQLEERKVTEISDTLLAGIRVAPRSSGEVRIVLDLKHSYEFSYRLTPQPASHLIVELLASTSIIR